MKKTEKKMKINGTTYKRIHRWKRSGASLNDMTYRLGLFEDVCKAPIPVIAHGDSWDFWAPVTCKVPKKNPLGWAYRKWEKGWEKKRKK